MCMAPWLCSLCGPFVLRKKIKRSINKLRQKIPKGCQKLQLLRRHLS